MGSGRPDFISGKVFIGGLPKETTEGTLSRYFEKYGEVTDYIIMKDHNTGLPRGFGFVTFADPSVVDTVIAQNHYINGKQVSAKRLIPRGCTEPIDFKTKKIFVGGIPSSVTEDEFKDFFSRYGRVVEHEITRNHVKNCGFGFIVFDSELVVDNILVNGNTIDMNGTQVEIKQAEPMKSSYTALPSYGPKKSPDTPPPLIEPKKSPDTPPPSNGPKKSSDTPPPSNGPKKSSDTPPPSNGLKKSSDTPPPSNDKLPKEHEYDASFSGYGDLYGEYSGGGYGRPYRSFRGLSGRFGDYGGYGPSGIEFGSRYSDFGGHYGGDYGGYRGGEPLSGYPSHFNSFGGEGFGGWRGLGGYGRDPPCYRGYGLDLPCYEGYGRDLPCYEGYGRDLPYYGGQGGGPGYEFGAGLGYGGARSMYHGGSRYHPYGR